MGNRRFILNFVSGFTILALGSGCGNLNSIHRELDINEGKGVLIDIKQRAIIAKNKNVEGKTIPIVCAEPSPDALSAFASALSGKVDVNSKVNVGLESQTQENASFVGLRTQSIQLLRDFLYRDCEAYMNEVIDKYQYDVLMRRNQKYMVALLGIEQLTGAVTSMPSTLNTNLSSGTGAGAGTGASKGTGTGVGAGTDNVARIASGTGVGAGTDNGTRIGSGTRAGTTPPSTSQTGEGQAFRVNNLDSVSSTIDHIVTNILNTDDIGQSCFAYIAGGTPKNKDLVGICNRYLAAVTIKKANEDNISNECLNIIVNASASGSKSDELIKLIKTLKDSGICKTSTEVLRFNK